MTKEKQWVDLTIWSLCILVALAFGAYLGSPVPKIWAEPVSEMVAAVSNQISKMESLHNEKTHVGATKEENAAETNTAVNKDPDAAGKDAAAENEAVIENETMTGKEAEADSSMEIIVSEPPAEEYHDEIFLNANRGGVADRKEMDVLIRLINAEAYGLSYKAKVAVGQVVMNRWTGPYYGNDLMAIMTAPHQFTPIYNGSAYKKEIEEDSIKAANAVLNGVGVKELTSDTYYFVNPDFTQDKTIETKMQFVCEIEGLHFFKPPAK